MKLRHFIEFSDSEGKVSERGYCTVYYTVNQEEDTNGELRTTYTPIRILNDDVLKPSFLRRPVHRIDPRIKEEYNLSELYIPSDFSWVGATSSKNTVVVKPVALSVDIDTNELGVY